MVIFRRENLNRYVWPFTVGACVYMYVMYINLCMVGYVYVPIPMCKCNSLCACGFLFVYVIVHAHV